MNDHDEQSYKRYKQYQSNRRRYKQEQFLVPAGILIIGTIVLTYWRQILYAVITVAVLFIAYYIYRKRHPVVTAVPQTIIITPEEASKGTVLEIGMDNVVTPKQIKVNVPPNTKNGDTLILRKLNVTDADNKSFTTDLHLKLSIKDKV